MTEDDVYARQVREIAECKVADAVVHLRSARRALRSAALRSSGDRPEFKRLLSLSEDTVALIDKVTQSREAARREAFVKREIEFWNNFGG